MKFHRPLFAAALALVLSVATAFAAEPYKVGDAFDAFTTKDQHEKDYTFAPGPRLVIVSFEMSAGKDANAFFAEKGATFLDEQQAVFIANIYGMPAIGRFFAMPKMKRYPHRILLADAETFLDRYPREENKLTVIRLDPAGAVTGVEFIDPEKGLPAVFAK
ncbi:MAG: hypothetical protein MUE42_05765 [Opitutaceae bacterium]|jgi:hypothetical protein|nr:hypothetical protein [Opitutaceae bacterium]